MIYAIIGGILWPLFWVGMKKYGFGHLSAGERIAIVTWLAIVWPAGVVIMACFEHGDRYP